MDRSTLVALIVTQVLFGMLPVAGKIVFEDFAALSVGAWRVAGGAILLLVLAQILGRTQPLDWKRDGKSFVILAMLGVVLNQGFFVTGLQFTSAVNATLVITTVPVFTYAVAVLMKREVLGPRRAAGIALALSGVVLLIGLTGYQVGAKSALGDFLVLLNCLSFGTFLVLSKPIASRVDPIQLTGTLFLIASVIMVPIGVGFGMIQQTQTASDYSLWWLAFILIGPTAMTYTLNSTVIRKVPASTVAVFIYMQPAFAALGAYFLLGEPLSWRLLPAAVLIFTGVYLVARRRPKVIEGRASLSG